MAQTGNRRDSNVSKTAHQNQKYRTPDLRDSAALSPDRRDSVRRDTGRTNTDRKSRNHRSSESKDFDYKKELAGKEARIRALIGKYGTVRDIVGMDDPYHYRNKVTAAFGHVKGQVISGTYKPGTHEIIPTDSNPLEDRQADEIIVAIRKLCRSFKIKTYDEDTGYGLLRYVMVRTAKKTGQIMVVLVVTSPVFPGSRNFTRVLREMFPQISTIVLNINTRTDSMVLDKRQKILYGRGYIEDELCGMRYRISPTSFYQINPVQTEKFYARALKYADLKGGETVIDAYCGIGTIGIAAAARAGQVIGVEINEDAVADARVNAKINGIDNIRFAVQDAGEFMVGMKDAGESADVVFMDPPRAGSTPEFIDCAAYMRPKRIIYISCNPGTLARDLELFTQKGYRMLEATPFDAFPMTEHVETVCLLSKLHEAKHHVNVTVDMDELDVTSERKAKPPNFLQSAQE